MSKRPDPALTGLFFIVAGIAAMIWSGGSFFRAIGDPGPGLPATVVSASVNRGRGGVETGWVTLEYTPPGGIVTRTSLGVPLVVARSYHDGQATRVYLRDFLGSTKVVPAEALAANDDWVLAAIILSTGLATVIGAIGGLILKRRMLFRVDDG